MASNVTAAGWRAALFSLPLFSLPLFSLPLFSLASIGCAGSASAQSADDALVYTIVDDAGSSEALFRSGNGTLVFRRNATGSGDERGDTTFYVRETWPSNAITSVSMDSSFEYGDDIFITITTNPDAIYREHFGGGQMATSRRSSEILGFPAAEAATANRVLSELKSLAGR